MKTFKKIYIRDKIFLEKKGNSYLSLGNPITLAKKFKSKYDGIYIIDLNLKNGGKSTNFDIYDTLTSHLYIQVDGGRDIKKKEIKKLYEINARVTLYCNFNEEEMNKKFSALYYEKEKECAIFEEVKDVIIRKKKDIEYMEKKGKRIFFMGNVNDERVFCKIVQ